MYFLFPPLNMSTYVLFINFYGYYLFVCFIDFCSKIIFEATRDRILESGQ